MRIVRYPLDIVDYQQLQPLWPGRVLSVAPGRDHMDFTARQRIDMWCIDDATGRGDELPPVLGVWVIGTGNPMPAGLVDDDSHAFHGTCVMDNGLVWHVFTTLEGPAFAPAPPEPAAGSVDEMIERIKERHAGRRQPS